MNPRRALLALFAACLFLAINTGSNLAYLLLSVILAGWMLQIRDTSRLGAQLFCRRTLPRRMREGVASVIRLDITHRGRKPLTFLRVSDPAAEGRCFIIEIINPGETVTFHYPLRPVRRGVASLPGIEVCAASPFEAVEARECGEPDVVLVHPAAAPLDFLETLFETVPGGGSVALRGGSEDFVGLKRIEYAERPSRIHWGVFARTGRLYRTEFTDARAHSLLVVLLAGDPDWIDHGARVCSTLVERLAADGGEYGLITWTDGFSRYRPGHDPQILLDRLAVMSGTAPLPKPHRLAAVIAGSLHPRAIILVPAPSVEELDAAELIRLSGRRVAIVSYGRYEPESRE